MRALDWPAIVATASCLLLLGVLALYFSSYEPKAFSARELAASRTRNMANCGAGMFDVVPHDQACARYDRLALVSGSASVLTLHADGRATLVLSAPREHRAGFGAAEILRPGRYEASVDAATFRELANLFAYFHLDRRGSIQPDAGDFLLRAGCGRTWTVEANFGGDRDESQALRRCLRDFEDRADWSLVVDKPVVPTVN
jgi:hypothetical protein